MDAVLVDTDVFSFLMKDADTRAALYRPHVKGKTVALCFVTVGELYVWSIRRRWNSRRIVSFEQRLRSVVIVPYDLALCKTYGRLRAALLDKGAPAAANDLWIASCAVRHAIPLLTHNSRHFASIPGLKVVSES